MELPSSCKNPRLLVRNLDSLLCKCLALIGIALFLALIVLPFSGRSLDLVQPKFSSYKSRNKFLEVPQIVWGLNNQKIAFARACLTARYLNRTLLMPTLSASLFYKELDRLDPISFDKFFQFERFISLCNGFVQLGRYSEIRNDTTDDVYELRKGSGRRWTAQRDLEQLNQVSQSDEYEVVRIVGKNPFLWHDHWPVKDYARVLNAWFLSMR
ncbi:O-fucosyltransferase 23 [Linum perenne]